MSATFIIDVPKCKQSKGEHEWFEAHDDYVWWCVLCGAVVIGEGDDGQQGYNEPESMTPKEA